MKFELRGNRVEVREYPTWQGCKKFLFVILSRDVGGCLPDVVEVCESAGKDTVVCMHSGSRGSSGVGKRNSRFWNPAQRTRTTGESGK